MYFVIFSSRIVTIVCVCSVLIFVLIIFYLFVICCVVITFPLLPVVLLILFDVEYYQYLSIINVL